MSDNNQGLRVQTGSQALRAGVELLSSMRFAISLLTVICIASVIGTVLKQHEPAVNYVNQFGPFWAEVFGAIHLNAVYSAWWFLLILAFLVTSTSLCIARNTPKILVDIKTYKENIREQSLKAFRHKAQADLPESAETEARRIGALLVGGGWKVRLQQRDTTAGPGTGWMVAAKAGAANKIGYIAAHSAIVLICLGGLFDGDLVVRAQMWFNGKSTFAGGGMIADVPAAHRLAATNPTFRGNLMVTEGTQSSTAILSQSDGILVQELPFSLELKKFIIEHYESGMPKLFASDVVIHDKATGEKTEQRIEVNHPARFKGIEIYQSGFDDGGSSVTLSALPMVPKASGFEVQGVIGGRAQPLKDTDGEPLALELVSLRTINVENFSDSGEKTSSGADVRKVDLGASIGARMGAANKTAKNKDLRNVGPSIGYKLRDAAGQAREYHNYMLPVDMGDGNPPVFLLGVRESQAETFRYLRVPVDEQGGIDGFMRMRLALQDPAAREQAVLRYATQAMEGGRKEMVEQLAQSASRTLALYAGGPDEDGQYIGGLPAIARFLEKNVPEAERERASEVLVRILNGALYELAQLTRQQAGLKPLESNEQTLAFMTQMVVALSDAQIYPAPVVLALKDFTQVQASVFEVARAPGKNIVYLGCALLIVGIFAMLYIRERRVWVWVKPHDGGAHATMALSTNRKTMDGDREFAQLTEKLIGVAPTARHGGST